MVEIKEIFKVGKRTCVVVGMASVSSYLKPYHNGYVSTLKKNNNKSYSDDDIAVQTDELTYSGTLDSLKDKRIPKLWFFGFDSAHYWNDQNPASKTFESVKQRTTELAKEMIKKKI